MLATDEVVAENVKDLVGMFADTASQIAGVARFSETVSGVFDSISITAGCPSAQAALSTTINVITNVASAAGARFSIPLYLLPFVEDK